MLNEILQLEQSLLTKEIRQDKEKLNQFIADDFIEHGSSGEVYDKRRVINALINEDCNIECKVEEFDVVYESSNYVQVRYTLLENNITSLRTSSWKKNNDKWQMVFHQGTKINKSTLYIICGLPASGKTTFAKTIIQKNNAVHLSEDQWMKSLVSLYDNDDMRDKIAKLHIKVASKILMQGANVVMDGGYYSKEERDNLRNIAIQSNARFELHYMNINFDVIQKRRVERNKLLALEFHTTEENIQKARTLFEPPLEDENPIIHK